MRESNGLAMHPALAGRVLAIDVIDHVDGANRVLPSTSVVLGFQFRGRLRAEQSLLSIAGVTGLQERARTYRNVGATGSVLVRFTPQGAACLGVPVAELANRNIPLAELLSPARVAETCERLQSAPDDVSRRVVVESFLLDLPYARDPLVSGALQLLAAGTGTSVAGVARQLGISDRQLERRFLARVGVTPRRYLGLRRFEKALKLLPDAASLADAALLAGYYDQSHFIREVRRFAGAKPSALRGPG